MIESFPREIRVALLLAGISALMYGAGDFCGGLGVRKSPLISVLAISQLTGLILAVIAAVVLRQPFPNGRDLLWGMVGGVCGAAGLAGLYTAIATTPVAVASPVAAVTGAVIPVLLGFAGGERPATLAWVGIALALPAIVLLSAGRAAKGQESLVRKAVILGLTAGLGFGLFFFAIAHTAHTSGLWPLVSARVATLSLIVVYAGIARQSLVPRREGVLPILLSGMLDMSANIAFLLASRVGMLTLAAVVTSLYPGPTVILALIFYRERLTLPRIAGLLLALAGVALISV